jgi:hypothetical protein
MGFHRQSPAQRLPEAVGVAALKAAQVVLVGAVQAVQLLEVVQVLRVRLILAAVVAQGLARVMLLTAVQVLLLYAISAHNA